MTFFVGEHTFAVKEVDVVDLLLSLFDLFVLAIDGVDVGDSDGDRGDGGVFEALILDLVKDGAGLAWIWFKKKFLDAFHGDRSIA